MDYPLWNIDYRISMLSYVMRIENHYFFSFRLGHNKLIWLTKLTKNHIAV